MNGIELVRRGLNLLCCVGGVCGDGGLLFERGQLGCEFLILSLRVGQVRLYLRGQRFHGIHLVWVVGLSFSDGLVSIVELSLQIVNARIGL